MTDTFAPIDPKLIDVMPSVPHDGYPVEMQAGDTIDVLKECCGAASREFPDVLWIEPAYRADKARDNDKYHTWGRNYLDRFTNQTPTHECTCHMLRAMAEGCRNRQRGIIFPDGPKRDFRYEESAKGSIWLSPLSIYAEANPRQWGGAGCRQVLDIACRRGMLPETIQPRDYGLKHAINGTTGKGGKNQASGPWVPLSKFPAGFEETGKLFMPREVIITNDVDQAICLLLWGYILGGGRNGHAIPYDFFSIAENSPGYCDSYDTFRQDSLSTFRRAVSSGVLAIASMPTPDDWLRPAATLAI